MDKIDILLRNPIYLHCALLKAMRNTHDKETYDLQKTLLITNYIYINKIAELDRQIKEKDAELDKLIKELIELGEANE